MVTAVSFHPQRDGVLAFGTAEGRVGVYDVLSGKHAAYAISHRAAVTVLVWCSPCSAVAAGDTTAALYSLAADAVFAW
jgi:gem associated protein 5